MKRGVRNANPKMRRQAAARIDIWGFQHVETWLDRYLAKRGVTTIWLFFSSRGSPSEGRNPLREALRGNLPLRGVLRGIHGGLFECSAGLCGRFCGGPQDLPIATCYVRNGPCSKQLWSLSYRTGSPTTEPTSCRREF